MTKGSYIIGNNIINLLYLTRGCIKYSIGIDIYIGDGLRDRKIPSEQEAIMVLPSALPWVAAVPNKVRILLLSWTLWRSHLISGRGSLLCCLFSSDALGFSSPYMYREQPPATVCEATTTDDASSENATPTGLPPAGKLILKNLQRNYKNFENPKARKTMKNFWIPSLLIKIHTWNFCLKHHPT